MSDWLDELECAERAVEPAPWEWAATYQMPDEYGGLEKRWAMRRAGVKDRVLSLGLVSESTQNELEVPDKEMAYLCALRNAAPRFIAIARAAANMRRVIESDDVPGYIGDETGWECGQCAPMDGSGKRPTTAEVEHEPDCFQGALEQLRAALDANPEKQPSPTG